MSIKPVEWQVREVMFDDGIPVAYRAIPDTHRVVSVELLNSIMELAGVALVYQPFGTKDRQNFDALMAIIEDKP